MTEKLTDVSLVWGTPGDIEETSDGGGDYSSTFRLTPRGAAKIAKALGASSFLWAEQCGHEHPDDGDAIHVAGEPSDMICLASPIFDAEPDAQHPEVDAFAERMRAEMIANDHKGDHWQNMTPRQAWGEISWHLGKLTAALKAEDVPAIRELAADIANGAMMLDQIVSVYDNRVNLSAV